MSGGEGGGLQERGQNRGKAEQGREREREKGRRKGEREVREKLDNFYFPRKKIYALKFVNVCPCFHMH